jgi:cytochrome c oxidase subunit 4
VSGTGATARARATGGTGATARAKATGGAPETNTAGPKETSARGLTLTLVALLALAGLSLALRYAHLGAFGVPVALIIAAAKAVLVAVFFMEILVERVTVRLAMGAGIVLLGILLALIAADILTREPAPLSNPPGTETRDRG